ncbi:unnamed protein product [Pocillopora meandrina]|uniref:Uncharacterized protein n=1 Tax=Pocillopora meandrina TaxID=46732 RepID=A0AAU9W862_9CNID|nr:unnamed protein product [Pocillopora meandrina]
MGWNENVCLDSGKPCENVRNDEDEGSWDDNESDEEDDGSTKEFVKISSKKRWSRLQKWQHDSSGYLRSPEHI